MDHEFLLQTTVTAYLADGTHKATWSGVPLLAAGQRRVMGALWRLGPRWAGPLHFAPGDLCLELFDTELHCNIFEVHGRCPAAATGATQATEEEPYRIPSRFHLKGWYINLADPARFTRQGDTEAISYTDWGLDFVVLPGGAVTTLDEDAYAALRQLLPTGVWRRAAAARAWLEGRLAGDGPTFIRQLYRDAAVAPGEAPLLDMVRHYGLPVAARGDRPQPMTNSGHWSRGLGSGERVAEALYAVDAGPGAALLHSKAFYPAEVLRLPGGGVAGNEAPDAAAIREAWEETGLAAQVEAFAAYMTVPLGLVDIVQPIPTYVFGLRRRDPLAVPVAQAEEQIERFAAVPMEQLSTTAWQLADLGGDWQQWGRYRAQQHWLAYCGLVAAGV